MTSFADTPVTPAVDATPDIVPGVASDAAEMSEFARGLFERQACKGYEISSCLQSTDRTAAFRASDAAMRRNAVIKALVPHPDRDNAVEEFFSLAGSIARLRSPAAARGYFVGRAEGNFFLAYEYIDGENLRDKLARRQSGKMLEKESLKLVAAIAKALGALYELGNPHGHLTPSNIMVKKADEVVLTDIGYAWAMAWPDDHAAFLTRPHHLPPERIRDDLNIDVRGDLYSLGTIWHLALLGEPVFQAPTPEAILEMHLEREPASPRDLDARLSAATSNLMLWLLAKDRDARPRTPKEFLRKLESHPMWGEETEESDEA